MSGAGGIVDIRERLAVLEAGGGVSGGASGGFVLDDGEYVSAGPIGPAGVLADDGEYTP